MKTAIQKNVRTLKAKAEAEAKAQKKADREARDKALLLQATRMAEADANARMLQRRAMGAAPYREAHPMVVNMSIDGIVGASVTLGHSNVVERQTAEFEHHPGVHAAHAEHSLRPSGLTGGAMVRRAYRRA